MASFLDKVRVKTAQRKTETFDLSCSHITSQNFNNNQPIYYRELIPNSKIQISASSLCRFQPMPVPSFMDVSVHNRMFFVPYHSVFRPFNDMINGVVHSNGDSVTPYVVDKVPYFNIGQFFDYFLDNSRIYVGNFNEQSDDVVSPYGCNTSILSRLDTQYLAVKLTFPTGTTQEAIDKQKRYYACNADIIVPSNDDVDPQHPYDYSTGWPTLYVLTARGRLLLRILESLGYRFDWSQVNLKSDYLELQVSALPILAYCRVIMDWFIPSSYAKTFQVYNDLDHLFNKDSYYSFSDWFDSAFDLMLTYVLPADYFTSALDNADTPAYSSQSINFIRFSDQNNYNLSGSPTYQSSVVSDGLTTPEAELINGSTPVESGTVTSWAQTALNRLSAFLKRNQLAGSKVIDRWLARYGIQLKSEVDMRSQFLGEDVFDVPFSDVMNSVQQEDSPLGSYAGKGVSGNSGKTYEYQTSEFGLFLIINVVTPRISYTQGMDRHLIHKYALDFFTPEFDNMGQQSIKRFELISPRSNVDLVASTNPALRNKFPLEFSGTDFKNQFADLPIKHFGFTSRYAEYKVARDFVTGRFSQPSTMGDASAYINSRLFSYLRLNDFGATNSQGIDSTNFGVENLKATLFHSFDFLTDDGNQYLRLFYNVLNLNDNIDFIHQFKVRLFAPMTQLFDSFQFSNEDYGEPININSQGTKV